MSELFSSADFGGAPMTEANMRDPDASLLLESRNASVGRGRRSWQERPR